MKKTLLALVCTVSASPALALSINFTGYENNSFFGAEQLEILNLAAWQYENRITDDVTINVTLDTNFTLDMTYPYALAEGGPSWWDVNNVKVTDIAGGSINYNVGGNFFGGSFSDYDLYSITLHELGHILGMVGGSGFAPWDNLLTVNADGVWFTGEYSVGVYGGLVPITDDLSHWDDSRWTSGINPSMFPTFYPGETRSLSELDYAALADMGWHVTFVPEPETWVMLLAGLGVVSSIAAKRRRGAA